jgi:glycosyltransferase involved in cell wall biosynthesis
VGVIPNLVDLQHFRFRERRPLGPRLLSTRNLESHYRVDVILDAFAQIHARVPGATLTVAGSGSQESALRQRALLRAGGSSIRFVGAVAPAAMPALYESADLYVNASVIDNQPVSILEAFAAGLPVVSTAAGDLGAMVRDGETGLTVPAADASALSKAVITLIEHPERARALARQARREVEHFTWPRVREAWARVYAGSEVAA